MNDHEITALLAENREKIREELRTELEVLFKKEKDALVERAQFLMNAAKWSAAALAVGFGLLGVKAWSDVRAHVEDYFKSTLEKTYLIDDATSPIRRSVDYLLDRALVNSLYAQVLREKAREAADQQSSSRSHELQPISLSELDRMLRLLKSPLTETSLFNDTVYVLNHLVKEEDRRQTVSAVLADLLAARQNSESAWMSSNERKRLTILSTFNKSEGLDVAASDLLIQPIPDRFKAAILQRIRREGVRNAAQNVVKLIDLSEDEPLKFECYLTLARIRPDHERVSRFITSDLLKKSEKKDLLQSIQIAAAIAAHESEIGRFLDDDTLEKRKKLLSDLAVPLVARAFDNGVTLEYQEFGFRKGLSARIRVGPSAYRVTDLDRAIHSDILAAQVLALGAGRSLQVLSTYLAAMMPKTTFGSKSGSLLRVRAVLNSDSEIVLADGSTLSSSNVRDGGVELRVVDAAPAYGPSPSSTAQVKAVRIDAHGLLMAKWQDTSGKFIQKQISAVRHGSFEVDASRLPKTEEDTNE
jgi:hypothetical protein